MSNVAARAMVRGRTLNHPGRLIALYLHNCGAARKAMVSDGHPGRYWWRRQHTDLMRKIKALRHDR